MEIATTTILAEMIINMTGMTAMLGILTTGTVAAANAARMGQMAYTVEPFYDKLSKKSIMDDLTKKNMEKDFKQLYKQLNHGEQTQARLKTQDKEYEISCDFVEKAYKQLEELRNQIKNTPKKEKIVVVTPMTDDRTMRQEMTHKEVKQLIKSLEYEIAAEQREQQFYRHSREEQGFRKRLHGFRDVLTSMFTAMKNATQRNKNNKILNAPSSLLYQQRVQDALDAQQDIWKQQVEDKKAGIKTASKANSKANKTRQKQQQKNQKDIDHSQEFTQEALSFSELEVDDKSIIEMPDGSIGHEYSIDDDRSTNENNLNQQQTIPEAGQMDVPSADGQQYNTWKNDPQIATLAVQIEQQEQTVLDAYPGNKDDKLLELVVDYHPQMFLQIPEHEQTDKLAAIALFNDPMLADSILKDYDIEDLEPYAKEVTNDWTREDFDNVIKQTGFEAKLKGYDMNSYNQSDIYQVTQTLGQIKESREPAHVKNIGALEQA